MSPGQQASPKPFDVTPSVNIDPIGAPVQGVTTVKGEVNPGHSPIGFNCTNTTTHQSAMPDPNSLKYPDAQGLTWQITYSNLPSGTYTIQAYMTCPQGSASDSSQFTI